MDELIDIITKNGLPTGTTALKSEIHTKGYYHNTAHIWFYTLKGEILLAQRASSKAIYPLLWDVSVAGHVDASETIEQAAVRETYEELSLKIVKDDLQKIGVFPCFQSYSNGIIDNEFHHTFISELKKPLSALKFNTTEVEAIKYVSIPEFLSLLSFSKANNHFVASNASYYKFVLECITQAIKN